MALASAAGVAIDNARLHARVRDLAVARGPRAHRDGPARHRHPAAVRGRSLAPGDASASRCRDRESECSSPSTISTRRSSGSDRRSSPSTHPSRSRGAESLRRRVITLVSEMTPTLRVEPRTFFDGPDRLARPTSTSPKSCLPVLREALSNVAASRRKRPRSTSTSPPIDGRLTLRVEDNGVGPSDAPGDGRGLRNMQARAEHLGGTFTLTASLAEGLSPRVVVCRSHRAAATCRVPGRGGARRTPPPPCAESSRASTARRSRSSSLSSPRGGAARRSGGS